MTIFEQNLNVLEQTWPDVYQGLTEYKEALAAHTITNKEQVLAGDALDGETFLALVRGEEITALNSTYHPSHEAMRYAMQFQEKAVKSILLLFGFSDGRVIRQLLGEEYSIGCCVVYEPSMDIFIKTLEEFDLTDVLADERLVLIVEDANGNQTEKYLDALIDYRNWRNMSFAKLSVYQKLFPDEMKAYKDVFLRIYQTKRAEMNTMVHFAKQSMTNEVKAMKWMIDGRTLENMKGRFPVDMPYIVVAAGPSLEKNVEVLRQAKGKAFIVCVDTAIPYLMNRNIIPDMICTVDPGKGLRHFQCPGTSNIPIALSSDSASEPLEMLGEIKPIYISMSNTFYYELYHNRNIEMGYFDGGGSVATVCFQIGVELGFHTIVIIGQDLAFTDDKGHAGSDTLTENDFSNGVIMVDAYNGGKIMTRGDYKFYIDWYNLHVPELEEYTIINATEGGAKLEGMLQMTLQEVVDRYCTEDYDVEALFDAVPKVWDSLDDKREFYDIVKKKYTYFNGFARKIKDGISLTERAIHVLKRGNYQNKELRDIDKKLNTITVAVGKESGMDIIINRMIETDISLEEDLDDADESMEKESIRLYEKMQKYLIEMQNSLNDTLEVWKDTLQEINHKYQFE